MREVEAYYASTPSLLFLMSLSCCCRKARRLAPSEFRFSRPLSIALMSEIIELSICIFIKVQIGITHLVVILSSLPAILPTDEKESLIEEFLESDFAYPKSPPTYDLPDTVPLFWKSEI